MQAEERAIGPVERLLHMRRSPVFGTLDAADLAVVAEAARPRGFRAGERLIDESTPAPACYFVVEGRVHVEHRGRAVGHATAGSALGGISTLAGRAPRFGAVAESDVLALELDADALRELLEDHHRLLLHLLRGFAGQVVEGWSRLPEGSEPAFAVPRHPPGAARELDLVDRIFFLRQVPAFAGASSNALAELARALAEVQIPAGDRLWEEGELARSVFLVVGGRVEGVAEAGVRLAAGRGAPLGALEAIAGRPRWYTATTTTPVVGLTCDVEALFDVLEDNADMGIRLLEMLAQWLIAVADLVAERDPAQLVAIGIVGVADPEPEPGPAGPR